MLKNKYFYNCLLVGFYLFFCTINYSCFSSSEPDENLQFGIYRLEDEKILWNDFLKINNKDSLKIKEWITPDMITAYDFSSHVLYLNKTPDIDKFPLPGVFVAVAGGIRCYYFTNWRISEYLEYCNITHIAPVRNNIWMLEFSDYYYKDIRDDDRVKRALIASGKFRGGIKLILDDIRSEFRQDTLYYEFSFTITNIDDQNLYLIDPLDGWYGYSSSGMSGLRFWESDKRNYEFFNLWIGSIPYYQHHTIIIPEAMIPENLLYIKRKTSISRKYIIPGKNIPYGNLRCAFYYSGAAGGASQTDITLSGGRVWIGYIYSNIMDVTISKEKGLVINSRNVILE